MATIAVAGAIFPGMVAPSRASCPLDSRWPGTAVTMSHNFRPSGELINGTNSWAQNAESAMREWSAVSSNFRFISGGDSGAAQDNSDGINNMIFDDEAAGDSFSDDVLAITLTRVTLDGTNLESDVIFNQTVLWNAFDGPIEVDADGTPVFDFRRVALHELGHVLGLDHPDEVCDQDVDAVMNARTTDTDRLTSDDRNGLSFIYSDGNLPPTANAGPDQFGDGTLPFVLNANRSRDPDGSAVQFDWRSGGVLIARGRVTEVELRAGEHLIELTVTDDDGATATDTLIIFVGEEFRPPASDNESPIADAGKDFSAEIGTLISLDASGSFDPDGSIDRYVWSLGSAILGREEVIRVSLQTGAHEIVLTVFDDSGDARSDTVIVTITGDLIEGPQPPEPMVQDPPPPATQPMCGALSIANELLTLALLAHPGFRRACG